MARGGCFRNWLYWLCRGKLWYFWFFSKIITQSEENLIQKLVACYKPSLQSTLSILCYNLPGIGIYIQNLHEFRINRDIYNSIYVPGINCHLINSKCKTWQKNRSCALWGPVINLPICATSVLSESENHDIDEWVTVVWLKFGGARAWGVMILGRSDQHPEELISPHVSLFEGWWWKMVET